MIRSLAIEPTNKCSLHCPECYARTSPRPQGFMDWNLFTKIVDEAQKIGVTRLGLNYAGEPTLHPQFSKMVDYVSGKGFRVGFATNGTVITKEIIKSIVEGDVYSINFSVHSKPLYETIYNNIQSLKTKRKLKKPLIGVSLNYHGQSVEELNAERKYWLNVADGFRLIPTIVNMNWKHTPPNYRLVNNGPKYCLQPMTYLAALWDGKATICCRDIGQENAFGDLTKYTLTETWNSNSHLTMLKHITSNTFPKGSLCSRCKLWNHFATPA